VASKLDVESSCASRPSTPPGLALGRWTSFLRISCARPPAVADFPRLRAHLRLQLHLAPPSSTATAPPPRKSPSPTLSPSPARQRRRRCRGGRGAVAAGLRGAGSLWICFRRRGEDAKPTAAAVVLSSNLLPHRRVPVS
jgi:hypothetical protein